MEDKFKGLGYWEIVELLHNCKNLDEEMDIYKKLVELGEETFIELQMPYILGYTGFRPGVGSQSYFGKSFAII